MLLSLVCEKRREEVIDELVEFIYQLSVESVEVAVKILKEPIHFIKRDRKKQLTLSVIVIRLNNNSRTDI